MNKKIKLTSILATLTLLPVYGSEETEIVPPQISFPQDTIIDATGDVLIKAKNIDIKGKITTAGSLTLKGDKVESTGEIRSSNGLYLEANQFLNQHDGEPQKLEISQ